MRFVFNFTLVILGAVQVLAFGSDRNLHWCKAWNCINEKVGLSTPGNDNVTFSRESLSSYLGSVLSQEWKKSIDSALTTCLSDKKPRRYSVTCPGQATWHCIVDQLAQNCFEKNLQKDDACTPIASLVGASYLFYQSSYVNFDREVQNDHRPQSFLRNNFNAKCCQLPALFNATVLSECHVTTFLKVQSHAPVPRAPPARPPISTKEYCSQPFEEINPLECCDTSDLVSPGLLQDCGVDLQWQKEERLVMKEKEAPVTSTEFAATEKSPLNKHRIPDVKVVPVSCPGLKCVFDKLSIVRPDKSVNRDAFSRLLKNMTHEHPTWTSARARVLTRCLKTDLSKEYDGCDIYKLVTCTLDVLSENCPKTKKGRSDPCRHSTTSHNTSVICQVSSSKFRRNRHLYCDVPRLVSQTTLEECGLTSLTQMLSLKQDATTAAPEKKKYQFKHQPSCINTSNSTVCILDKLGVLNKFKFMDYYKMKELVDGVVTKRYSWTVRKTQLQDSLRLMPDYREYCTSTRKLLNLMDAAVTNCPFSKRKYTSKCTRFYGYLSRCTNNTRSATVRPTIPIPTVNLSTAGAAKPLLVNITFPNSNKTVLARLYTPVITHTVVKQPKYAPRFNYYIPSQHFAFPLSRNPPAIVPPNVDPSVSSVYSPIFSHNYVPSQLVNGRQVVPVPYRPYIRDNYRSSNPYFLHNKIASAHQKDAKKLVGAPGTHSEVTPLQHLQPVEAQVYE